MDNMTNFCKNLQLNENRRCFWHIVMLCKFISITGTCTCISPESHFPSAYGIVPYAPAFDILFIGCVLNTKIAYTTAEK